MENVSLGERGYPTTPHFKFKSANPISPSAQVRFYADSYHPTHPRAVAMSDKFLEVNVEGEWGLVCFEPSLSRSVLTVLCRDLEGKFGQWSRPGTPQYYNGMKRCECHCSNCITTHSSVAVPYIKGLITYSNAHQQTVLLNCTISYTTQCNCTKSVYMWSLLKPSLVPVGF